MRCEEHIIEIGEAEEKDLAQEMGNKKITAALDEMCRGKHPCLVAIETMSNYILLERFTDDRTAETIPYKQLEKENLQLRNEVAFLNEQLEWFKRQIFGQRSERIVNKPDEYQLRFEGFEKLQTETRILLYQRDCSPQICQSREEGSWDYHCGSSRNPFT